MNEKTPLTDEQKDEVRNLACSAFEEGNSFGISADTYQKYIEEAYRRGIRAGIGTGAAPAETAPQPARAGGDAAAYQADLAFSTVRYILGVPGAKGTPREHMSAIIDHVAAWPLVGSEAVKSRASEKARELVAALAAVPQPEATANDERLWRILMYYANETTYDAPRVSGVLAGCERGAPPSPEQLTAAAKEGLRLLREKHGCIPDDWMLPTKAAGGGVVEALRPFAALLPDAVARGVADSANIDCQMSMYDVRRAYDALHSGSPAQATTRPAPSPEVVETLEKVLRHLEADAIHAAIIELRAALRSLGGEHG